MKPITDLKSIYSDTEAIPMKQLEYFVALISYQCRIDGKTLGELQLINDILNNSICEN